MKKTNLKQRVAIYVVAIMLLFSVGMPTIANANVGFEEQYEEVFDELSEYWEFSYDNSGSMLSDEESDELSDRIAQLFDASHSEFNRLDSDCDSATSEVHLLVVKTFVEMDFSELGAKQVICWFYRKTILEFSSEDEMLTAYEYLSLLPNVEWVEIDSYLPCRDDSDIFSYISEWNHYGVERHSSFEPFVTNSWGVGRTNNDRFAEYVLHSGFARNAMIVAVIDSGVDTEHRIFRNPDGSSRIYGGRNFIGTASDLTNRGDAEHGTAVAGIIVDNTPGLNHVQIMPIVVDGAGGTPIRVADGIRWAARRDGVQVMNMSFRIRGDVNVLGVNTIESAIQYAVNRGITVVVAAGNEGRSIDPAVLGEVVLGGVSPARMPGVITVAATTRDNERWILTNWGNRVNISAPGHAVRTSCHISGESAAFTGTSMAVPHVSAAVAMYRMRDPELSSATVRHRIETRYVETPGNWRRDRYGNGILNMARAIPAGWQPPGGGTPPTTPPNLPVHTVTFFPNGGSGGSARYTQNFVHGQAQNLRRNTWTRPGYTFMGWASIPNGNVHYTEGQRVNILASHHLYAVWQIVHTVTFWPNDGGSANRWYTQTFVHDQAQYLRRNTWQRPGYAFVGWASIPNGNVHYTEGQRVNILASHYLYAVWRPIGRATITSVTTTNNGRVTVNWTSSGNATNYDIYLI
ncbi:MAG: S8 family serine peptidase, partial [Oscillospiraceae bacterium]|nr:S8 family serine peptidase [Oscillospiraceae bacterium]